MAITFFGAASTPADNGNNTGATVTITPPSSMTAGMLVRVLLAVRSSTPGLTEFGVSNAGGQDWHMLTDDTLGRTSLGGKVYACVFNGTWTANPSFSFVVSVPFLASMQVFQHDSGSGYRFRLDREPRYGTFVAGTTPFTKTIAAVSTKTAGAVAIADWLSVDDNQWGNLTGSVGTWAFCNAGGANQIRENGASNADISATSAYQVFASAGSTGTVSANQTALGGDAGLTILTAFALEAVSDGTAPTVDVLMDAENSTNGTTITTTILGAATRGSGSSWGTSESPTETIATAAEMGLDSTRAVVVGGTTYDGTGDTRGIERLHSNDATLNRVNFTFSSSHAIVSFGVALKTNFSGDPGDGFSFLSLFDGGSSNFGCLNMLYQEAGKRFARLECNSNVPWGPILDDDTEYWITTYIDTTSGIGRLAVFKKSGSVWAQVGLTIAAEMGTGSNLARLEGFQTGGELAAHGGHTYFDDVVLDWTNAVFPLLPGSVSGGTTIEWLPTLSRQAGSYASAATAVPTGATSVGLWIDRSDWTDPALTAQWLLEWSPDGATWESLGGAGGKGGTVVVAATQKDLDAFGAMNSRLTDVDGVLLFSGSRRPIPEPANPNRQVRATVTLDQTITIRALLELV